METNYVMKPKEVILLINSKKKKNKSVVQDSSEIALVGNENDVKDFERYPNKQKRQEIYITAAMNITRDSLDGSYLSTLPK